MLLLYVAGPYSGNVERNINQAREIAVKLWQMGHAAICPHLNTAHMDAAGINVPYRQFICGDLMMVERCDGIVMTPDWETSPGARLEHSRAVELGKRIWVYPSLPDVGVPWP